MKDVVTILCSGFGLGFYIPGLLLEQQLKALGIEVETEVFESLMTDEKKSKTDESRNAYHASFAIALGSQRIPADIRRSLDPNATAALLDRWIRQGRRHFISLSGHWVHILDMLRERGVTGIQADLLHVDSDLSPSWKQLQKLNPYYAAPYREIELYDKECMAVKFKIDVTGHQPLAYAERNGRLVLHGGGWGIGTYQQKAEELEQSGYGLDIAAYRTEDIVRHASSDRDYFMNDPQWRTWMRDAWDKLTFPPFARVPVEGRPDFRLHGAYHGVYDIIRTAAAVISKPGAGALIDSLAATTPLVLLEPFGTHERKNAEIWKAQGFGIDFEEWRSLRFDRGVLERLHFNLLNERSKSPDYAAHYAAELAVADGRGQT
ncbi:UDP-glucuronosyltransferase [Paenibacillus sp. NRS-1782]|uniref:UDP-glucuronosyltransferase n=1 Tax=unclassified Paenibacillus TaxID=185978 RepID=UPI003D2D0251